MRRLQFALVALIATTVGVAVCATPSMADAPGKKTTRKKVTSRSRSRKACPPKRIVRTVRPVAPPKTQIIYRDKIVYRDRVVKAEISQATLDKLKKDIIDSIKIPEPKETDLTPILTKLDSQEKMIQMLLECCEQYKKDKTFDLRKTAHFEEQLCDILTLIKQQQECLDMLCKKMPSGTTTTRTTVTQPLQMKPAKISVSRDIDGNIFDGEDFRVQLGYDLGKFPLFGGTNSALQLYADHFEVGQPTTGAGLSGRFYTNKTGRLYMYGGAGVGAYTTNFAQDGPHQTEAGGKVFVGLETNRRSFVEFNVTSIQNYGANSRKANVYFGQRF
ncbi:MAG: hypothetical protein QM758_12275 [Armatimonas sp.]